MKATVKVFAPAVVILLAAPLPAHARADCGVLAPASWDGQNGLASGSLRLISDSRFHDDIVGMWRVKFIAKGNPSPLPPDGVVIDDAFAQWHSDRTEIMNSSRNPATQSFCLGVWERVGSHHYLLNHFAISWDPTIDTEHPQGPANIREDVTLSLNRKSFSGTFTIDQFDRFGNLVVHLTGVLEGTRITVDTPVSILF
jgi:hypothetical protein